MPPALRPWALALCLAAGCGAAGAPGPEGPGGPAGPAGMTGPAGADGSLRIYGDGSAGPLLVQGTAFQTLATLAPGGNLQFTDVTIELGARLSVPSGVVLRCTGTFTNRGTLSVSPLITGAPDERTAPAPGLAIAAAGNGELGAAGASLRGGNGGRGLPAYTARTLTPPGPLGGGGGGVAQGTGTTASQSGGGTLTVLARGAIVNSGSVGALSTLVTAPGAGGGAGGVLVLGSAASIDAGGLIAADGGPGTDGNAATAPGGGGGGGIVHLIAPMLRVTGTLRANGGDPGAAATISAASRSSGGGGGACGGDGGQGGGIGAAGAVSAAQVGKPGHVLQTQADPTALF